MDSGKADTVTWIALDDSTLLAQIPIRGAVVHDTVGTQANQQIKFISRFVPQMNPGGLWNCVGATFSTLGGTTFPVFAPYAHFGQNYEQPDETFGTELVDGQLAPWTPRRALLYFWLLANISPNLGIPGLDASTWRSIYASERISWDFRSVEGMRGVDPAYGSSSNDPLDRKLPDMNFRGDKMLFAIEKVLVNAGTHGQRLVSGPMQGHPTLGNDKPGVYKSVMDFYPKGFSGVFGGANGTIPILRGGEANTINTAFDFQLDEDATKVAEACLVEGDPVRVETSLDYDDDPTDTLKPAWTDAQELAFMYVVRGFAAGGYDKDTVQYARIPPAQGTTLTDHPAPWEEADGQDGRVLAFANTPDAVQLARQCYPTVFRAFRAVTAQLGAALDGADDRYSDTTKYPRLSARRPIMPEQLQFLLKDIEAGDSDQINWLRTQYPVRIRVQRSDGEYVDAPLGTGIRVTGDGLIWLDGLAEAVDRPAGQPPAPWCIYEGSIYNSVLYGYKPTLRSLKINAAVPMDHRVSGYRDISINEYPSLFAESYKTAVEGFPLLYVDAPGGFQEHHQVDSEPSLDARYYTQAIGGELETIPAPITRLLPPGSEDFAARDVARRRLATSRHPVRRTSWKLCGIRPEYAFSAGDWIHKVRIIDGPADDQDYIINAPVMTVTFDFAQQMTIIGGLISNVTGANA